jgi:hypothetical protein
MALTVSRWSGPLLALLGLVVIAVIAGQAPGARSTTAWWILTSALTVERVVPLLGLGAAVALLSRGRSFFALALFVLGTVIGFKVRLWFLSAMAPVPGAVNHLYLTGPLSSIAAGLLLIVPAWARSLLFAPVALLVGAMLAVAIELTDPTLDDLLIPCTGVAVGLWIVSAITLTARAFYRDWFPIAAKILGSWLLAAGLLYGSASLIPRPALLPPPTLPSKPAEEVPFHGFDHGPPGLDELNPGRPPGPSGPQI